MKIVRPITNDGAVGFDEFGQLVCTLPSGYGGTVSHFIEDVREKTCAICAHGWEATGRAMDDQHRWSLIDDCVHRTCLVRHLGLAERAEFRGALDDARIRHHGLRMRENGYGGPKDPWSRPWYYVELADIPARIDFGWRKRVISIELRPQGGTELTWWRDAEVRLECEDVTKSFAPERILVHAWGVEKMADYLGRLAAAWAPSIANTADHTVCADGRWG